jgi:hypothetical protein
VNQLSLLLLFLVAAKQSPCSSFSSDSQGILVVWDNTPITLRKGWSDLRMSWTCLSQLWMFAADRSMLIL